MKNKPTDRLVAIDGCSDTLEIIHIFNRKFGSILDDPKCQVVATSCRYLVATNWHSGSSKIDPNFLLKICIISKVSLHPSIATNLSVGLFFNELQYFPKIDFVIFSEQCQHFFFFLISFHYSYNNLIHS